jgi:hypothetical protein
MDPTQSTRRDFGRTLAISSLGAASLPLIGCIKGGVNAPTTGQSIITTTLELIIPAAETILPFIPGLNGAEAAIITAALNGLATAVPFAVTELASTDTPLERFTKISLEFGTVALSSLNGKLGGAPAKVLTIITAIATDVSNFLASINPPAAAARGAAVQFQLTPGDLKALPKIAKRAAALKAKLGH